jgi:hypothetical protein
MVVATESRRRFWVIVLSSILISVILTALLIYGLVALAAVIIGDDPDDPFDPGFSHSEARDAVARELCPGDPDRFDDELTAYNDSGIYYVHVDDPGAIEAVDDADDAYVGQLVVFGVARFTDESDELRVDSSDAQGAGYMARTRASPACR